MKFNNKDTTEIRAMLAEMAAETEGLKQAAGGSVTEAVAAWLGPQYLRAARDKLSATDGGEKFGVWRTFMQDWSMLRRGDHSAARLQLDREKLEWERANGELQKEKEFREWLQRPDIQKEIFPERTQGIRPETLAKIERELRLL